MTMNSASKLIISRCIQAQSARQNFINLSSAHATQGARYFLTQTTPCQRQPEMNSSGYVSPFASFFENIDKKRTSTHLSNDSPTLNQLKLSSIPRLKCGISEDVLTFKTRSFFRDHSTSPHVLPAEHQIILYVSIGDLPLKTQLERKIFLQLIGGTKLRRYNPEKKRVKLISNQFASRIENKRHVVSMLDRLVLAALDLANEVSQKESVTHDSI